MLRTLDLTDRTVGELGALLRRREVSAVALTEAHLARIEALNSRLNAFLTVTGPLALERARRADAELASGRDRGPLHGIPYALKDVIATKGILTTNGSKASAHWVPAANATVEDRLDAAGSVLLGKLNLWEFAMVGTAYGEVHNPWALEYSPGGSSSGAGASVAAGLVPIAIGTDTGGSVRIPAAHCGIVGLRPTYGRVSRYGVTANAWSVDTVGPITGTVEDQALVLAAIVGADPNDRTSAAVPPPVIDFSAGPSLRHVRIGIPKDHFFNQTHPDVESAVRRAIAALVALGATTVTVDLPHAGEAAIARTLHLAEAASFHERRLRNGSSLLGKEIRTRLERAASYSAVDYVKALRLRTLLVEEAARAFDACDVIVAPTDRNLPVPIVPPATSTTNRTAPVGGPNTAFASMTGLPALALPCGFSAGQPALPVSMLLHAPPFDEAALLRIGHAYQRVTDWHARRPEL